MQDLRILIVSALGHVIQPVLAARYPEGRVVVARSPDELQHALESHPRFDLAFVDLLWHDRALEWRFDGLDALTMLYERDRTTPAVCTIQGEQAEDDHLAEALDRTTFPAVVGVTEKAVLASHIGGVVDAVALSQPIPVVARPVTHEGPALHTYFARGRGRTAGTLAAAVATGRADRYEQLASLAHFAPDTANKLTSYLAPLLLARNDVPPGTPITQSVVYRWCGERSHYLLSWARRNIPTNIDFARWDPTTK